VKIIKLIFYQWLGGGKKRSGMAYSDHAMQGGRMPDVNNFMVICQRVSLPSIATLGQNW
jgi:hypothetical protein